jgi:hypothetical protein
MTTETFSSFDIHLYIFTGTQNYYRKYSSCNDAFSNGMIHPEPGKPVTLVLTDDSLVNCTIENIFKKSKSCPVGWYGNAESEICIQVKLQLVTNEEACR